jgi:hypothetical protein
MQFVGASVSTLTADEDRQPSDRQQAQRQKGYYGTPTTDLFQMMF